MLYNCRAKPCNIWYEGVCEKEECINLTWSGSIAHINFKIWSRNIYLCLVAKLVKTLAASFYWYSRISTDWYGWVTKFTTLYGGNGWARILSDSINMTSKYVILFENGSGCTKNRNTVKYLIHKRRKAQSICSSRIVNTKVEKVYSERHSHAHTIGKIAKCRLA